jgi:hypothetical protein
VAIGIPPLPRPASGNPDDMKRWADGLIDALSAAYAQQGPAGIYIVDNLAAPVRTIDCAGAATAAEVAEVVGSLIDDLKARGQLA